MNCGIYEINMTSVESFRNRKVGRKFNHDFVGVGIFKLNVTGICQAFPAIRLPVYRLL